MHAVRLAATDQESAGQQSRPKFLHRRSRLASEAAKASKQPRQIGWLAALHTGASGPAGSPQIVQQPAAAATVSMLSSDIYYVVLLL